MKKLALLTMLLMPIFGWGQEVYVKNNTGETVWMAYGYTHKDGMGATTKGWYKLTPGKKVYCTTLNFEDVGNVFLLSAHTKNCTKVTHGEYNLLVHPTDAFKIKNADKSSTAKRHPEFTYNRFFATKVSNRSYVKKLLLFSGGPLQIEITSDMLYRSN